MTRTEFKNFLINYKKVNEAAKEIIIKKYPFLIEEREDLGIFISHGKVFFLTNTLEDGMIDFDITKEVMAELMPDDFVF